MLAKQDVQRGAAFVAHYTFHRGFGCPIVLLASASSITWTGWKCLVSARLFAVSTAAANSTTFVLNRLPFRTRRVRPLGCSRSIADGPIQHPRHGFPRRERHS